MSEKKCLYNVFQCPRIHAGSSELIGSFENEDDANNYKSEKAKEVDNDHFIVLVHKHEYEVWSSFLKCQFSPIDNIDTHKLQTISG